MAGRNDVPSSVSFPIPGFAEAQTKYVKARAAYEDRERRIAADRAAWFRSSMRDTDIRARAKLMSDLNPLTVAAETYFGEMTASLAGRVLKPVFSGKMRPGYVRMPGSFGGAYDPAPYTGGGTATLAKFDEAARIIKDIYKNPEARKIVRLAHETGNRSNPVVKLLDSAKNDLARARTALSKELERDYRTSLRNVSREFLKKDVSAGRDLAKSIKSGAVASDSTTPTLWTMVRGVPGVVWRNKGKVGFGASALLAGTVGYRTVSRDKAQDVVTGQVNDKRDEFARAYSEFTGDNALKLAMSDKNALRAGLIGMRNLALAEVQDFDRGRVELVRTRLRDYIDSVKDSDAFKELEEESETAYATRAIRVDDYQSEFRDQFRDPASRALGEHYWPKELGDVP